MAITWRNVSGPTGADELRVLAGASQQIGGAFEGLQRTLANYQADQGRAFERQKAENTNAFLDALSQYSSPEALQAAQASGEIDRLRSSFGKNIDSAATRGAADALLATRRQQALSGRQFDNQVAQDTAAPILSQIQAKALAGDSTAARELAATLDPRFQGAAAQSVFNADKDLFGFKVAQNNETRAQAAHEMGLKRDAASIRASDASAAASSARTALTNFQLSEAKSDRSADDVLGKLANAYQVETKKQKEAIDKVARANPSMFALTNGKVDYTKMDSGQIAAADALLKQQGLRGMDIYTAGDTEAQQQAVAALRQAGASQKIIDRAMKRGDLFSTAPPDLIGNDAEAKARANKLSTAADNLIVEAAGGAPLSKEQFNQFLTNDLPKQIGHLTKEEQSSVIRAANKWSAKLGNGIDIGNGVKTYPSASMITNAINSTDIPLWGLEGDIQNKLKTLESNFKEEISKARQVKDKKAVK